MRRGQPAYILLATPHPGQDTVLRADACRCHPNGHFPEPVPGCRGPSSREEISCAQAPPYGNEGHAAELQPATLPRRGRWEGPTPPCPAPGPSFQLPSRPALCAWKALLPDPPKAHIFFGVPLEDIFLDPPLVEC